MEKKQIVILAAAVVLAGGLIYFNYQSGQKPQDNPAGQNSGDSQPSSSREEMPQFILGKVTKLEEQKIILAVGAEQKTATLVGSTTVVKQVKDKESYKNIDASAADIKVGAQIVVYYSATVGTEYVADKIQILPF